MIRILPYAVAALAAALLASVMLIARRDRRKPRPEPGSPDLAVVIPAYNCRGMVAAAVESLYRAYDPAKLDLVVVDDASTDGTAEVLARLKDRYGFRVLTREANGGHARAISDGFARTNRDIILNLDADTEISRPAILELLARLRDPAVGAVSARYLVVNRGFLPRMTGITYALLAFSQAAQNHRSSSSLWGGGMMFKREAWNAIGELRSRMIIEDMDAALRLAEAGWRVEQSWRPVETRIPGRLSGWLRQQARWSAGMMQCLLTHPHRFAPASTAMLAFFIYWLLSAGTVLALILPGTLGPSIAAVLAGTFALLSVPPALASSPGRKGSSALLAVPYTLVFFPFQATIAGVSFAVGIVRFFRLRRGGRAW